MNSAIEYLPSEASISARPPGLFVHVGAHAKKRNWEEQVHSVRASLLAQSSTPSSDAPAPSDHDLLLPSLLSPSLVALRGALTSISHRISSCEPRLLALADRGVFKLGSTSHGNDSLFLLPLSPLRLPSSDR